MEKKIGLYGAGNMGRAMIEGILHSGIYQPQNIVVYEYSSSAKQWANKVGIVSMPDSKRLIKECSTILLAVKPAILIEVLAEIACLLSEEQLILSVAAGVTVKKIESMLSPMHKIIRVMPNTPSLVGEGMASITGNQAVTEQELQQAVAIFSSFGKAEIVPEKLIDAVIGVSGSSPAYVYMFIEALADGAVLEGMPRKQAYQFAAQTVLGAAKMVLETEQHPGELKDMVASPGGTTIKAIESLEKNQFRSAVIQAVKAAAEKSKKMSTAEEDK